MFLGSLIGVLVLISALRTTAISGLRYNVPLINLSSIGCSECKDSSSSAPKDLASCSGPYLFFGLKSSMADVFDIATYKEALGVNTLTLFDSPFEYKGNIWHYTGGNQGMTGVATLTQLDDTSGPSKAAIRNRGGTVDYLDDGKLASSNIALSTDVSKVYIEFTFTCPKGMNNRTYNLVRMC
jgi:hypothetical protein